MMTIDVSLVNSTFFRFDRDRRFTVCIDRKRFIRVHVVFFKLKYPKTPRQLQC